MRIDDNNRLLTVKEVMALTALTSDAIYLLEKKNEFPMCVRLGYRTKAYVESEIQTWIDKMIEGRTS